MKHLTLFIISLIFFVQLRGQDTIPAYQKITDLDVWLYYNSMIESDNILPTPDGGTLLFFSTKETFGLFHTFLVKTDSCLQKQWVVQLDEDQESCEAVFSKAHIDEEKGIVYMFATSFESNKDFQFAEKIFAYALDSGELIQSWTYPAEFFHNWLGDVYSDGTKFYFTYLDEKSFARTNDAFEEEIYCEFRDTLRSDFDFFRYFDFSFQDDHVVYIGHHATKTYDSLRTVIQYYDLNCNLLWERIVENTHDPHFAFTEHHFFMEDYYGETKFQVFDYDNNFIFASNDPYYNFPQNLLGLNQETEEYFELQYDEKGQTLLRKSLFGGIVQSNKIKMDSISSFVDLYEEQNGAITFIARVFSDVETYDIDLKLGRLFLDEEDHIYKLDSCFGQEKEEPDDPFKINSLPFLFYPNPVSDQLTVRSKDCDLLIQEISITNSMGHTFFESNTPACEFIIDVNNYQFDVYLLKVVMLGEVYVKRILVW